MAKFILFSVYSCRKCLTTIIAFVILCAQYERVEKAVRHNRNSSASSLLNNIEDLLHWKDWFIVTLKWLRNSRSKMNSMVTIHKQTRSLERLGAQSSLILLEILFTDASIVIDNYYIIMFTNYLYIIYIILRIIVRYQNVFQT